MKVIRDIAKAGVGCRNAVIALGNFDGLHLGHRAILARAKEIANQENCPLALMTFEPHPRNFLSKEPAKNLRIYSVRSKLIAIQELGVDCVFMMRFNENFANLSAHDFIREILLKELGARHIVTGENFYFGKNRSGDNNLMTSEAELLGFGYTAHPKICDGNGDVVSSSTIRKFLSQGEVKKAANLLGKPYHIKGRVKHGEGRGRVLGFPTANISLEKLFLPRYGVYAVRTKIEGNNEVYKGVANLGIRPSFGASSPNLEVHLFDTNQDLYGKRICVEFVDFIREEQKFSSIEQLKEQIEKDCTEAKNC